MRRPCDERCVSGRKWAGQGTNQAALRSWRWWRPPTSGKATILPKLLGWTGRGYCFGRWRFQVVTSTDATRSSNLSTCVWVVSGFERPRGDAVVLTKHLAEVVPGSKAALCCNFLQEELPACDQSRGLVDPELGQIASWRYSTRLLELSREMEAAHLGDASHVFDTNGPRQVEPAEQLDLADKCRHRLR